MVYSGLLFGGAAAGIVFSKRNPRHGVGPTMSFGFMALASCVPAVGSVFVLDQEMRWRWFLRSSSFAS